MYILGTNVLVVLIMGGAKRSSIVAIRSLRPISLVSLAPSTSKSNQTLFLPQCQPLLANARRISNTPSPLPPLKEVRMLELRNITQVASNELQPPCPFKPLKFKHVAYN